MRVITPPQETALSFGTVFLAGGISGCPDWQSEVIDKLQDVDDLTLFNPRRANFPMNDPVAAYEQIAWEHQAFKHSMTASFWFCAATVCPIVLYELGAWSMKLNRMIVGIEPGYLRSVDVRVQTRLARPEVEIVNTLDDLADLIAKEGTRRPPVKLRSRV